MRTGVKALAVAAGVAAALAATTSTASASAGEARTAAQSWYTCSDPVALTDGGSTAVSCISSDGVGNLSGLSVMHFNSANPAGWTACQLNSTLFRVNSDGTETALSSAPMTDCLDAAHTKADLGAALPWAAITASGNYRVRLGIAGSYNGTAVLGYAGSSPVVYVGV
ncbi:hypothetical protein [Yinghuangia aomiensis]